MPHFLDINGHISYTKASLQYISKTNPGALSISTHIGVSSITHTVIVSELLFCDYMKYAKGNTKEETHCAEERQLHYARKYKMPEDNNMGNILFLFNRYV